MKAATYPEVVHSASRTPALSKQRRAAAREDAVQHAAHELDGPLRAELRDGVEQRLQRGGREPDQAEQRRDHDEDREDGEDEIVRGE